VSVITSNGCAWTASSQSAFITITSVTNSTGNGAITFSITTNTSPYARTGTVLVASFTFTVVQAGYLPPISLAAALETPGQSWVTSGAGNWFGQNATTHDGIDAARSGPIQHLQQTILETSVAGPGTLTYWWKVSSETNYDFLRVLLDGVSTQSISGEVDWQFRALAIPSGNHTVQWRYDKDVSINNGQDAAWIDQIQMPLRDFMITSLATNATIIDHEAVTGDDRGSIAASSSHVFYSGDNATARFSLEDLSGGTPLAQRFDALVSDLQTEKLYVLASNNAPVAGTTFSGLVNRLLGLTSLGVLDGSSINLSQPIPLHGNYLGAQPGIFAGYRHVVIHNRTNVFSIALPSGLVNDLGALDEPVHASSESWAYWGVAEYFSNSLCLVYVRDRQTIVRRRVVDGSISPVAIFTNLNDMACFTVSVPRSRWYFHHEAASQFGGVNETLGWATARFAFVPTGYFVPASMTRLNGNTVRMEFRGPPVTTAVIQVSTNLTAWSPIATNALGASGIWIYTNTAPGIPRRFYRAFLP
jgi:hypothetical protein